METAALGIELEEDEERTNLETCNEAIDVYKNVLFFHSVGNRFLNGLVTFLSISL